MIMEKPTIVSFWTHESVHLKRCVKLPKKIWTSYKLVLKKLLMFTHTPTTHNISQAILTLYPTERCDPKTVWLCPFRHLKTLFHLCRLDTIVNKCGHILLVTMSLWIEKNCCRRLWDPYFQISWSCMDDIRMVVVPFKKNGSFRNENICSSILPMQKLLFTAFRP